MNAVKGLKSYCCGCKARGAEQVLDWNIKLLAFLATFTGCFQRNLSACQHSHQPLTSPASQARPSADKRASHSLLSQLLSRQFFMSHVQGVRWQQLFRQPSHALAVNYAVNFYFNPPLFTVWFHLGLASLPVPVPGRRPHATWQRSLVVTTKELCPGLWRGLWLLCSPSLPGQPPGLKQQQRVWEDFRLYFLFLGRTLARKSLIIIFFFLWSCFWYVDHISGPWNDRPLQQILKGKWMEDSEAGLRGLRKWEKAFFLQDSSQGHRKARNTP